MTYDPADDMIPSWSRDGRWIYFTSGRSGRPEVWKTPAAGGAAVQMTRAGGGPAFESTDGEFLYYTKLSSITDKPLGGPLFRLPVRGGPEEQLLPRMAKWPFFGITAEAVYFSPDFRSIQKYDFGTGKVKTLVDGRPLSGGLCASPDGRFVVWAQFDRLNAELMAAERFR